VLGGSEDRVILSSWPLPEPGGWVGLVNRARTEQEVAAIRHSIRRGQPHGSESWGKRTARALGLESTLRPRGRPRTATARA
jgi:putative transposase